MSQEAAPREASTLAAIFQKAYARAVALQRLDEQIAALLDQRQKLEVDFRDAQSEVNQECERMLTQSSIAPAKLLAQLAEHSQAVDGAGNGNGRLARVKPTPALAH